MKIWALKKLKKLIELWQLLRYSWEKGKTGVTILLIFVYVICYSSIALTYEIDNGWSGYKSFQNLLKDISTFVPVAGAFVAYHILEIDIIMLFSDIYRDIREKRDRKIKEESIAEGINKGKAEERRLWSIFLAAYQGETESGAEAEEDTSDEPSSTPPKVSSDDSSE